VAVGESSQGGFLHLALRLLCSDLEEKLDDIFVFGLATSGAIGGRIVGIVSSPSAMFRGGVDVSCVRGNIGLVGRFGCGSCISYSAAPARRLDQLGSEASFGSRLLVQFVEARGWRARRGLRRRFWVGSHCGFLICLFVCRKGGLNGLWNKPSPRFLWRGHDERRKRNQREKPRSGIGRIG
jgi:hypothetical protein